MSKVDEITTWEAFLGVASHGSFSQAARSLKLPLSQVSKRVAKLESQMGVRLFQRTTRVVTLTDEGRTLQPKIRSILEDLRETEALFEDKQALSGKLKITVVPFVANNLLIPLMQEFSALHPKIHFELELSETFANIVDAGFDMAIRIETPSDSELVYRKLAPNDLVLCASPTYLAQNIAPLSKPKDLREHSLLMLGIHRRCRFVKDNTVLGSFQDSKKVTCENGDFLTSLALAGSGVLVRSIWDVRKHLESGALVQVLMKHPLETFGHIHAVVPSKRYLAPRVRAFLDFIVDKSTSW